MPFKLPKHLLEWLKQRGPEAKIEQLVRTIGQVDDLIQGREDALSALVRKHLFMAEEDCTAALVNSKFDNKENNSECLRRIEFGLFRLELAKQQLTSEHLESCPPNFDESTLEYRALELSGAIIKTKMAIEFCNCVVSEGNKLRLVSVVKMFNDAIEFLKSNKQDKSRRVTEAGLLLLYMIKREIEIENHESIVDLNYIWKNATVEKSSQQIKKAIEASYNLKTACCDCPSQASPKVLSRLDDAMEKLQVAIDSYLKAQDEVVDELVTTSMLQIKLASEAFQSSAMREDLNSGKLEQEDQIDSQVNQFKTLVVVLQRLVTNRATQAELANRRLDAAEKYYQSAARLYGKALEGKASKSSDSDSERNKRVEMLDKAEALARSARIDLEFARNLLFKKEGLPYQELIKRIADDSDNG
jgi:hypothetical protein